MKKLLALVLALVMTLSLATVGTSAAFSDADSIEYKEAVDVMSAVGVLAGMDDGSFNPTGSLTREQGAKIITYILLGGKTAGDALTATSAPFSDVAADRWSAGSIQYCVANGIIAGKGDGTFGPTEPLTGYAFGKMLLGALGYDAAIEGLTGNEWQVNTAKLIARSGLSDKIAAFVGTKTVTREVAAQMGLNALNADVVEYTGGVSVSGSNDTTVNSNRSTVVTTAAWGNKIDAANNGTAGHYLVQLGEQVFGGDLELKSTTDSFGASAKQWTYNVTPASEKVTKTPIVTYTGSMTSSANSAQVNSDLLGYHWGDATDTGVVPRFNNTNQGVEVITSANGTNGLDKITANGRVVEVYDADGDGIIEAGDIIVKQYDLYEVTSNIGNTVTLTLRSSGAADATPTGISSTAINIATITVAKSSGNNTKYFEQFSAMKTGDYVLLACEVSANTILDVATPTKATGAYTAKSGSNYTIDGTTYKASANVAAATATTLGNASNVSTTTDYDVYTDANGFALLIDSVTTSTKTYAVVLATSRDGSASAGYTYSAKLLLPDGTVAWKQVKKVGTTVIGSNSDSTYDGNFQGNSVYTSTASTKYFVEYDEQSDGTFNFVAAPAAQTKANAAGSNATITNGSAQINVYNSGNNYYTVTSKTVFLVQNSGNNYTAYTGLKNVPTITTGTADTMFAYCASGTIANMVLVINNAGAATVTGKNVEYLFINNYAGASSDTSSVLGVAGNGVFYKNTDAGSAYVSNSVLYVTGDADTTASGTYVATDATTTGAQQTGAVTWAVADDFKAYEINTATTTEAITQISLPSDSDNQYAMNYLWTCQEKCREKTHKMFCTVRRHSRWQRCEKLPETVRLGSRYRHGIGCNR